MVVRQSALHLDYLSVSCGEDTNGVSPSFTPLNKAIVSLPFHVSLQVDTLASDRSARPAQQCVPVSAFSSEAARSQPVRGNVLCRIS